VTCIFNQKGAHMVQPVLQLNPLQSALFQALGLKATAKDETADTFGLLLEKLVSGGDADAPDTGIQAQTVEAASLAAGPDNRAVPAELAAEPAAGTQPAIAGLAADAQPLVVGPVADAQFVTAGPAADAQLAVLVAQPPPTPPPAMFTPAAEGLTHALQHIGGIQAEEAAVFADTGKSLPQQEAGSTVLPSGLTEGEMAPKDTVAPPLLVNSRQTVERATPEIQLSIVPINVPRSENGISSPAPAIPASAAQQLIPVRVDTSAWASALGERMILMANRLEQVAELKLNPPHLGPLEVKLHFSGGEASAQFFAPQPAVREALETAVPRLREMFSEIGVQLGNVAVDTPSAHGREPQPGDDNHAEGLRPVRSTDSEQASRSAMLRWEGWVDTFA
jgi:flagellar hook-length control protein FliK